MITDDTYESAFQISDWELKLDSMRGKAVESSLFEEPLNTYGVEAYTQLIPSNIKLARLFKMRTSSSETLKTLLVLKQLSNTAFVPIAQSTQDVMEETKLCFGSDNYSKQLFNYLVPKKYSYKNPFIMGSKLIIKMEDIKTYTDLAKQNLPRFQSTPSFYIKNKKNVVIDFSSIFKLAYPNTEMVTRPTVLATSEKLGVQLLSRLLFGVIEGEQPLLASYISTIPPVSSAFDNIIVSIPVVAKDIRIATMYIDPDSTAKIPSDIRRNPDSTFLLGILRFVVHLIDNWPFENSPLEGEFARRINEKQHIVFLFHNDTHGFYIDPYEIKEKGEKFDTIYRMLKLSVKTLLSLNARLISPLDVSEDDDISKTIDDNENNLDKKIDENAKRQNGIISDIRDDTDNTLLQDIALLSTPGVALSQLSDPLKDSAMKTVLAKTKYNLTAQAKLRDKNAFAQAKPVVEGDADEDTDDTGEKDLDLYGAEPDEEEDEVEEPITKPIDEDTETEEDSLKDFLADLNTSTDVSNRDKIVEDSKIAIEPKLTVAQKKRLDALHDKYKSIRFSDDRTFEEILADTESVTVDVVKSDMRIKDDSYNYSTLRDFSSSYLKKTMARDTVAIVKSFSENKSINMHIIDFEKKDISDQFNNIDLYVFELEDDKKQKHKIKFKFPKVDDDGFMWVNGNKKYLKKQWILKPVTKTCEWEVYLMSNYNKTHIYRQGTVLNKNTVVVKKLVKELITALDADESGELHKLITITRGNNVSSNADYITTIEYDELSSYIHRIQFNPGEINEFTYYFNQKEIRAMIAQKGIKYTEQPDKTPIGIDFAKGKVIEVASFDSSQTIAGQIIETIRESDIFPNVDEFIMKTSAPRRRMYTRIELQSKEIPLVVFLSALYTFEKVLEVSKIETIFVSAGNMITDELAEKLKDKIFIEFSDGRLYYDQYPIDNALLLNGLAELDTTNLEYADLNTLSTYLDYLYSSFKNRNVYKGWTAFKELFIDPITRDILNDLKLPTDFLELFLYANGLLGNNSFVSSSVSESWRLRDYEIFNSLLYDTIATSYRTYKQKGKSREGFSIPEDDILKKLNKSFVFEQYDITNPVNELRSRSTVTFKGPKGINSDRAFSVDKRGQTRSTVGTVGISSIENGNVGIVKQLTLSPRVVSTRGYIDAPVTDADVRNIPSSSLMTAEESVLPYVNRDDPKRIGFASGQTKHVIPADDFTPPIIGTGFEQTIIYKTGNDFGYKAKRNGTIVKVDDTQKFLVIKYDDGTADRVDFGSRYNRNSDFFLSNNLEANVKEGDLVKKGEVVTYNKDFFKKHMGRLMFTQGVIARVAVTEGEVTEEDSCAISQHLANKLTSSVIKKKQIVLGPNANIVRALKIGDFVRYGDALLLFEDFKDTDSDMSLLDLLGQSDDTVLDSISRHSSHSNATGHIIDIKMYWTVEPELMGESCKKFVKSYIKEKKARIEIEEQASGCRSKERFEIDKSKPYRDRINSAEVAREGGIVIEYFVSHSNGKIPGDKVTVNSSLKSVITQVIPDNLTPRRFNNRYDRIDCVFSFIGINARMVSSVWFNGYLGKILFEYGKRVADEFFDDIGVA